MAKIKVGELKELNKQVTDIKEVQITNNEAQEIRFIIEVLQYLPVLDKINFTSGIAKGCINREDGLFIVNHSSKNIAFSNAIIENYTNLTLPKVEGESGIEAFDLISRSGILDVVLENIPGKELSTLYELLENKITEERDRYNQENKLEAIIKKGVDGLLFTIDNFIGDGTATDLIESVKTSLNGIEPDKLQFVQDFIKTNSGVK